MRNVHSSINQDTQISEWGDSCVNVLALAASKTVPSVFKIVLHELFDICTNNMTFNAGGHNADNGYSGTIWIVRVLI